MAAQHDSKPSASSVRLEISDSGITRTLLLREESASAADEVDKTALRAEYQTAVEIVKLLTDIRFRCLVFVTAVIAIANALLPNTGLPGPRIALGFVGFFTTLGIAVYELRNSQFYEAAVHRAMVLERRLQAPPSTYQLGLGGLFNERPPYVKQKAGEDRRADDWEKRKPMRFMRYLLVKVKHDQGLALIYGAVLGGWFYLIVHGVVLFMIATGSWPFKTAHAAGITAAGLGFFVFVIAWRRFIYHDDNRFSWSETKPAREELPQSVESIKK